MADETLSEQFLNPTRQSYAYESSKNSGNRKRVIMIIAGIIILIALVVFAIIATGGQGDQELTAEPKPTESINSPTLSLSPTEVKEDDSEEKKEVATTPTKAPTATPADADLDRSDLSIAVQNGSGVAGAATKASDFLEGLGYEVVSTGNADNFDYTETIIKVKSSMKKYLDQLEEDLSDEYTIGSATADYTGEADALVIVGAK